MKISKVKQLLEILETCNPDAEVYMTSGTGEITDIIAVDQPASDIVIVKSDDHIYQRCAPINPETIYDKPTNPNKQSHEKNANEHQIGIYNNRSNT